MVGGRGMRHAGLPRHRAQCQAGETVTLQHFFGRLEQRVVQRAVMIWRFRRRGAAGRRSLALAAFRSRSSAMWAAFFGFSRHNRFIGRDFYTVKISLDAWPAATLPDLYDVKINLWERP